MKIYGTHNQFCLPVKYQLAIELASLEKP